MYWQLTTLKYTNRKINALLFIYFSGLPLDLLMVDFFSLRACDFFYSFQGAAAFKSILLMRGVRAR